MRIGIDASRANLVNKTGTEWYAYRIIQELKKIADPKDQLILYSKDKLTGDLASLPNNFASRVLVWPPQILWTQLRLSINQLIRPPDKLFIPAHTLPLIHPKKTILTVHDIGFEVFDNLYSKTNILKQTFSKKLINFFVRIFTFGKYGANELDYHRWAMRFAIKHASLIICPSNFTKNEIIKVFKLTPDKVKVVYHGVDRETYQPISNKSKLLEYLKRFNISFPYFLYIGRLEEKKNTAGLIQAYARFTSKHTTGHKLVLAGTPGYNYENIQNSILKSGLAREIIILGYVKSNDLVTLLNGAEAFVFPSFYEGFGLPLLEAMACGTPVIASNRASIPEVVGTAARLVNPSEPDELAEALSEMITQPNLRAEMIRRGFDRIRDFNWSECAKQTLKLIKNI